MNNAIEVQVSISGGLGEADRGAPIFNIIPKTGGNTFSGNDFGSFAGQWGQSSNIDDELRALGFADAPALLKNWDNNFSVGGPIKRDKLWFFANSRTTGNYIDTQNQYANKNAGNAERVDAGRSDESVRVRNDSSRMVNSIRLTSQVTPRNKVGFFIDYTMNCTGSSFTKDSGPVPQPGRRLDGVGSRHRSGCRHHVAGVGHDLERAVEHPAGHVDVADLEPRAVRERLLGVPRQWGDVKPDGAISDLIPVTEQSTNAGVPMANYHLPRVARPAVAEPEARHLARDALVRVRQPQPEGRLSGGLHGGEDHHPGRRSRSATPSTTASPIQLSTRVGPTRVSDRLRYSAFYVQDAWTRGRLTPAGRAAVRNGVELEPGRARTASSTSTGSAPRTSFRASTA